MNQVPTIARPNRWLYIDFNSYFASVEQQLNPHLRGKPVIVLPVMTDATSAIAASYEAKAFGIRTGTPVWEAKERCPGLICVLGNHEAYVDYHNRAIAEVWNHIPVTKICSIDEIACRLMSNENSIERSTQIALSIKRGLAKNVGEFVKCSIGIAPNRYLAKVATDMHKPDGLTFLNTQDLPHKLYTLSLRDLPGIGRNMERRINRQGIWDIRTLCELDAKQMRRLWGGIWGERMWYYLRGVELADAETTRSSVSHSHVMAPELRHPEKARYVARRLTLKAASRLRRLDYEARAMSLSIRMEEGPRYFTQTQCTPASDSTQFLNMLEEMWTNIMHTLIPPPTGARSAINRDIGLDLSSPRLGGGLAGTSQSPEPPPRPSPGGGGSTARIKKVSITLYDLRPSSAPQTDLFAPLNSEEVETRRKAERMSKALDTLNQRYGRDTVALGMMPEDGRSFSGTKIAFTRIPDVEEFLE